MKSLLLLSLVMGIPSYFVPIQITEMSTPHPAIVEIQQEPVIEEEKEEELSQEIATSVYCSCVQTAKSLGVNIPSGNNASDLEPNTDEPQVGQLVLLHYPKASHVAVILSISEEGYLIEEGNYHPCEHTTRFIKKDYHAIYGFWTEV